MPPVLRAVSPAGLVSPRPGPPSAALETCHSRLWHGSRRSSRSARGRAVETPRCSCRYTLRLVDDSEWNARAQPVTSRTLIDQARRGQILRRNPQGFVHSDFVGRAASLNGTVEHLADLAADMTFIDDPSFDRVSELAGLRSRRYSRVHVEARARHDDIVRFARGHLTGPDQIHVRTRLEVGAVQHRIAGSCHG